MRVQITHIWPKPFCDEVTERSFRHAEHPRGELLLGVAIELLLTKIEKLESEIEVLKKCENKNLP